MCRAVIDIFMVSSLSSAEDDPPLINLNIGRSLSQTDSGIWSHPVHLGTLTGMPGRLQEGAENIGNALGHQGVAIVIGVDLIGHERGLA